MNKIIRRRIRLTVTGLALLTSLLTSGGGRLLISAAAESRRTFVYTMTNPDGPNAIAAYEANAETGELIFLGTYLTGGRGTGRIVDSQSPLVVNTEASLLFAVNPGSNDISVLAVRDNGSLDIVGTPVSSRGIEPATLALRNNLLYVANKGDAENPPNYAGFRVESDGALDRIKKRITLAVGDNPTQVLFSNDSKMLIGIRFGSGSLDCFRIKPNGKLRRVGELNDQRGPFAGLFNPLADDQLIVADARLPGASSYLINGEGSFSQIAAIPNAPERAACWIAVHSDGCRAWVSNTGTHSVSLYTIGAGGTLSLAGTHSTLPYGRTPFEIVLDPAGRFLYQLNIGRTNRSIHVLRVTGGVEDAGLEDVGAIGLPPDSSPIGLVVTAR